MRGRFITFEGIDGSGKTTQAKLLLEFLRSRGLGVVLTREPGGTAVAEKIRNILLDRDNIGLCARAELFLYLASRAQHTQKLIRPALEAGRWVISDRFTDSSVAYQGVARGLGIGKVMEMSLFATGGLRPDVTFFLDIPPHEAARRMTLQGKTLDRLEVEGGKFLEKVREGYLQIAELEPQRFIVIDGMLPPSEIGERVQKTLFERFPELRGENRV